MRKTFKLTAAAWISLAAHTAPAQAQDAASAAASFRQLNDTAVSIYQDAKRRFLARADPVIIAGGGSVLIRHRGGERRVGQTPDAYHVLKTIGHVPRSIWAALIPALEGLDPEEEWRAKLARLRDGVETALRALPRTGLPQPAAARADHTLHRALGLIDRCLAHGAPSRDELQQELREFVPALLADAADAARDQLEAIDREVRPWWNALGQDERRRTMVVVLGAKTARPGNVVFGYFVNLLGVAESGNRVVYAESLFDDKGADGILATLLAGRRLAVDFFADERRMERDLLADGAQAVLLRLFGRLGVP
ncbi:MAG: hypothetical protein AB7H90_12835 [Alphaproteobacteria bacterium]